MSMVATKGWTLEDLYRLPEDGNTYEVVHGELFVTPPPAYSHELVGARLSSVLTGYADAQKLGRVFRPRAVVQRDGSQVEPDLMVSDEGNFGARWLDVPLPLLVVEILSPTTRRRDREHKRSFYAEIGVQEYWIVDLEEKSITRVRSGKADVTSTEEIVWQPSGVETPLSVNVKALFHE